MPTLGVGVGTGPLDHAERINRVLSYIEENLDEDFHLDSLARRCALSKYHFHRIFRVLVGESLGKYVERRRLSRAAVELLETKRRIVDIAFDHGFGSHETFTRSFKKSFSITPSRFRTVRPAVDLHRKSRIGSLDLRLRAGVAIPNPEIRQMRRLTIAGLSYTGRDTKAVYQLWRRLWESQAVVESRPEARTYFGACVHDLDMRGRDTFTYIAGVETAQDSRLARGTKRVTIPQCICAVFTHEGPASKIEETFDRVYGVWLPCSDYTPTMDLDLIRVDERFRGEGDDSIVEILMPVREV